MREVGHIADKYRENEVADHISEVVTTYYDDMGWKKNR
jgi:hypothetical protein